MSDDRPSLRVLVICFSRSSLGHVTRGTAAAARFRARGHDALLACSAEAAAVPAAAGVPWAEIDEIEPAPAWRGIRSTEQMRAFARTRLASPEYLRRCLDQETELIGRYRPDVVISDMRNSAGVAAAMAGVPSLAIHNLRLFVSPMNAILPEVLNTLAELGVPDEYARRTLGDVLVVPGLSLLEPLSVLPPEVATLILGLPREIRYVGPLLAREPVDLPGRDVLRKQHGRPDRPLVNVTLGGSAGGERHIVDVVAGLAGLDADLVVTTGHGIDPEQVRPAVQRFRSAAPEAVVALTAYRDDALEVMRAADVAVVHGGHATTMEGLYCGTPLVFVPHTEEQVGNAERTAELGAGLLADPERLDTQIRGLVDRALDPATAGRCAALATRLGRGRGTDALVEYVQSHVCLGDERR